MWRALFRTSSTGKGACLFGRIANFTVSKKPPKFLKMENVVTLPHIGSATIEGRIAMGERVIVNVKSFVDGHKAPNRVLETLL